MSKPGNPPQTAGMMLVENRHLPVWLLGLLLVLMLLFFVAAIFLDLAGVPNVPFHLHSDLSADYSKDPAALQLPVMRLEVVEDALDDLGAKDASQQIATLQIVLSTPAPTVTPAAGAIFTALPPGATGTPVPQPTLRPTDENPTVTTVVVVTLTLTPAGTPTVAITATLPPTSVFATPTPTRRATLPATQANPTATHANTPRPTSPQPTQPAVTDVPPTPTLRPTDPPATATPRPTNPPPTSTPRPTNPPPTDPPPPTPEPYPYP